MYNKVKNFKYEHLGHSFILDIEDSMWSEVFTPDELEEIEEKALVDVFYKDLPAEIVGCLSLLDKKNTFECIYNCFKDQKYDRYEHPELYWCVQSILDFIDLFHGSESINVTTEQDLLDEVYGFVKKSRTISKTTTSNASGSLASSEAENKKRKISGSASLARYKNPNCYDLVFKKINAEIGCLEIGHIPA